MANAVNLAAAHNSGSVVGQNLGTINSIFNASPTRPASQCIEALDVTDAMADRASIICPVEGTCDWIEQHPSYQEWLSGTSKPLCVIGGPGKGKTSLAVHVSLALETASRNEKYTFAYFFCNHQDPNRNSACAVLRTILAHIIKQHPHSVVFNGATASQCSIVLPPVKRLHAEGFIHSSTDTIWCKELIMTLLAIYISLCGVWNTVTGFTCYPPSSWPTQRSRPTWTYPHLPRRRNQNFTIDSISCSVVSILFFLISPVVVVMMILMRAWELAFEYAQKRRASRTIK